MQLNSLREMSFTETCKFRGTKLSINSLKRIGGGGHRRRKLENFSACLQKREEKERKLIKLRESLEF